MFTFCMRAAALVATMLPPLAVAAPLTLSQALDLALQRSETTRSARASLASASEAARAASQFPDPVLRAGIDNLPVTGGDRLSTTRESMTMKRIGIAQEWISSEKRAARQAAAYAMVGREVVSVQAAAAEVRLQTALAFLDAYYAGETLNLTTQSEHHLHEELEAAKARLSSSAGSSQDVLAATSARGIAEDESAEVKQQQSAARVSLERWVGILANELAVPTDLAAVGRAILCLESSDGCRSNARCGAGSSGGRRRHEQSQAEPEVERVFGKAGRADTATDPAPLEMFETTIQFKPRDQWRAGMTPDKLVEELDRAVKVPGLSNVWVPPIRNRIDMLATGIKSPVGIKVAGMA